jgi:hypothetical protein
MRDLKFHLPEIHPVGEFKRQKYAISTGRNEASPPKFAYVVLHRRVEHFVGALTRFLIEKFSDFDFNPTKYQKKCAPSLCKKGQEEFCCCIFDGKHQRHLFD